MAFTGRLGSSQSKLGNIALGVGEAGAEGFSFTARALLLSTTSASFTADAELGYTFTANAVIKRIESTTFTANAEIVDIVFGDCYIDDFNRGSLGSDYTLQNGFAYINSNELVVDANVSSSDDWDLLELDPALTPWEATESQMDFWVPADPTDDYIAYELGASNRSIYIENIDLLGNPNSSTWAFYGHNVVADYEMVVTPSTWYTVKQRLNIKAGSQQYFKVWPRDDPEPDDWTAIWPLASTTTFTDSWIYLDASTVEEAKVDNFSVCEMFIQRGATFTADAVINYGATWTADAILKKTQTYPAHPTVRATTTASGTSNLTDTVTMPTTGENDLVLAFITIDGFATTGGAPPVITPPSGWTLVADDVSTVSGDESVLAAVYSHRVGTVAEPASYQWTANATRAAYRIVSIQNAGDVTQVLTNAIVNAGASEQHEWTLPELTTEHFNSLVFGSWHTDNFMAEADYAGDPSGWTDIGNVVATTNATVKVFSYPNADRGTALEPELEWPGRDFVYGPAGIILEIAPLGGVIYANAVIDADTNTFTADAYIEVVIHPFPADAIIKRVWSIPFNANAYIIKSRTNVTFTANAVIKTDSVEGFFTANAVFHRDHTVAPGLPRLRRATTLTIHERREKPLDPYVPPRIPEEKDKEGPVEPEPHCLPPCAGIGAGGDMNGWGSIKVSITKCAFCDNYWRSDSEYLGQGSGLISSAEHCGYCGAHSRDEHITRLWVNYPSIPDGNFLMRAKLTWDKNGPDNISVLVYSVPTFPTMAVDGCESSFPEWDSGELVGRLNFVNDAEIGGYIILGNEQYKYQDEPSTEEFSSGSLQSNVFMFALSDEATNLQAKFRAASLEWPAEI